MIRLEVEASTGKNESKKTFKGEFDFIEEIKELTELKGTEAKAIEFINAFLLIRYQDELRRSEAPKTKIDISVVAQRLKATGMDESEIKRLLPSWQGFEVSDEEVSEETVTAEHEIIEENLEEFDDEEKEE